MNTRHTVIDSPLGELTLVGDGDALIGVYFPHHWYRPPMDTFGPRVDAGSDALLAEAQAQLTDFLAGDRMDFDLPTSLRGDERQRRVWGRLTAIPYGGTVTYGDLATAWQTDRPPRRSGRPSAAIRSRSSFRVTGWSGRTADSPGTRAGSNARSSCSTSRSRPSRGRRGCSDGRDEMAEAVDSADWGAVTAEINDFGGALLLSCSPGPRRRNCAGSIPTTAGSAPPSR